MTSTQPETLALQPGVGIPNSELPVLLYRDVAPAGDLLVVGAYPNAITWHVRRGGPGEYDEVAANIAAVPLPEPDPLGGTLTQLWR